MIQPEIWVIHVFLQLWAGLKGKKCLPLRRYINIEKKILVFYLILYLHLPLYLSCNLKINISFFCLFLYLGLTYFLVILMPVMVSQAKNLELFCWGKYVIIFSREWSIYQIQTRKKIIAITISLLNKARFVCLFFDSNH